MVVTKEQLSQEVFTLNHFCNYLANESLKTQPYLISHYNPIFE
jgi:hypothetical protein